MPCNGTPCFASLLMTILFLYCEERSDEAIAQQAESSLRYVVNSRRVAPKGCCAKTLREHQ
jgi:hypothetical protein